MLARLLAFTLAITMALTWAGGARAQSGTPEPVDLFSDLGLPELTVTVTETELSIDKSEIPAGRYLVVLKNETSNPMLATGFVRLQEGQSLDELSQADEIAAGTPMPPEGPDPAQFAFLYEALIVPGATALSPYVVTDLPAGAYGVWTDDPTSPLPAAGLTVTGDASAAISGPEPVATATISMEGKGGAGFSFALSGDLKAGPQIVKITNVSDQPHFTEIGQYSGGPITAEQILATFMFDASSGATPPADMLDMAKYSLTGWGSAQSAGTTQWVMLNLAPGQVVFDCWIPDPLMQDMPHALGGMIQVFDVK